MTSFATDKRSVALRERKGTDVEQIKKNTITEIKKAAKLSYRPHLFTIDCLPFEEDERKVSLETRDAILDYIAQLRPVSSLSLRVAKTDHLKQIDDTECEKLRGEINGYKKRLQEVDGKATEILDKIEKEELKKTDLNSQLANLQTELQMKDSDDLVVAEQWSLSREWKFLKRQRESVNLRSDYKIAEVKKWTNGHCKWENEEQDDYTFKCQLEGEFTRGLYASLTLETTRRNKYAKEIREIHTKISSTKASLSHTEGVLSEVRNQHKEFKKIIDHLEQYIEERGKRIEVLSTDYLTLEEAHARLGSLSKHS